MSANNSKKAAEEKSSNFDGRSYNKSNRKQSTSDFGQVSFNHDYLSDTGSFKPKSFALDKIKPGSFAHKLVSESKGSQDIISKILTKNGSKDF